MKIPLRELEQVRKDPRAYLRRREGASGGGFNPKSKYATLQRAALHYHKSNGDLDRARKYLEDAYAKLFKDQRSLQGSLIQLNRYADAFAQLGSRVFQIRDRLSLSLPEAISREINLIAQIPRLDLTLNGYAVWLFAKEPSDLRSELRLPLIQEAYSRKLSARLDEITVGVYDFATANYESYSFTQREINKATDELGDLVERLVSIARPRTLREL
jgi:hypothetical protein